MSFTADLGEVPAIDATRHPDVSNKHIEAALPAQGQRLVPSWGLDHVETGVAQLVCNGVTDEEVVFNQKNTHATASLPYGMQKVSRRAIRKAERLRTNGRFYDALSHRPFQVATSDHAEPPGEC